MVTMDGATVWRNGRKIGYLEGTTFYDEDGREVGWYEKDRDAVFWRSGVRAGYIEDGYVYYDDAARFDSADHVYEHVGGYSALCAAAAALLFGEDG